MSYMHQYWGNFQSKHRAIEFLTENLNNGALKKENIVYIDISKGYNTREIARIKAYTLHVVTLVADLDD